MESRPRMFSRATPCAAWVPNTQRILRHQGLLPPPKATPIGKIPARQSVASQLSHSAHPQASTPTSCRPRESDTARSLYMAWYGLALVGLHYPSSGPQRAGWKSWLKQPTAWTCIRAFHPASNDSPLSLNLPFSGGARTLHHPTCVISVGIVRSATDARLGGSKSFLPFKVRTIVSWGWSFPSPEPQKRKVHHWIYINIFIR